ncbi:MULTISPECIES: capsular polysaccharide export protein, LipB/KpsS family [Pseudoalteromonas]|uniref:capsular polysaccharide export protein, LipB/KpsS family n=1 Tax=Pseudoalteromonas TaxID=53246 RepID=UPI0002D2B65B|nr:MULTISPECIES: hypothetical protein [Pseudoalteromonas]MCF6144078.1 capsular polysaccharide export protein [Pseudoalteromonas mariniglutinosa NCIMB 1770]
MHFLFVSRRNIHARYYKKLIAQLDLHASLHIFGKPMLSALTYLPDAFKVSFDSVIATQLKRKQAKHAIWHNYLLILVYSFLMNVVERCRYAKYLALFKKEQATHLVIWNGHKLPNVTVVNAAKKLGISVIYYENGLLPNTTCLDPKGVNYASSIQREKHFYLDIAPSKTVVCEASELTARVNHRKRKAFMKSKLPARYIFVPFQVPHDTQLVCYSPWVNSMEMLFTEVMTAIEKLNDPDLKVVFKEHPSWHKHYSHLYKKHPQAVFANGNMAADLINNAEYVITINSTVGLEALLLGRRVITLGQACYNIDELVLHAGNSEELIKRILLMSQGWQFNPQLRDQFFNYLKHVYSIEGRWQDCCKEHAKAVEQRLLGLDVFSQQINEVKDHNEKHSNLPMVERALERPQADYF